MPATIIPQVHILFLSTLLENFPYQKLSLLAKLTLSSAFNLVRCKILSLSREVATAKK